MTDPFCALRVPGTPIDPDPSFAISLRVRLERALTLPRGVVMDQTNTEPAYRHGDVGYAWLSVRDVEQAATFYEAVLGWTVGAGHVSEGRSVAGRTPDLGLHGGQPQCTLNCCYAVDDIAEAVAAVRVAGGLASDPTEEPYGVMSNCTDDQGTVFAIYQPPDGVGTSPVPSGGEGDLVYVSFDVVDAGRARAFYGGVLGWSFTEGGVTDGWQVAGGMAGLQGGHPRATTLPMWQVADIAAAVERVLAAGGTSSDVRTRPYGLEAECVDDQGTRFYLGQL